MTMMTKLSGVAMALAMTASGAAAADLDPIFADDANMFRPAELGSGWYLRGQLGANINGRHDVFSSGTTADDIRTDDNFTDGYNFSIGVGRHINDFVRVEVSAGRTAGSDYRTSQQLYEAGQQPAGTDPLLVVAPNTPNPCNGRGEFIDLASGTNFWGDDFIENCIRTDNVEYDVLNAMVEAYVDLPKIWRLQPFVGAGIGVGRVSWTEEIGTVDCTPVPADVRAEACQSYTAGLQANVNEPFTQPGAVSEGVEYNLAYSLSGGLAYDVNDRLTMDAMYKYMNFGGTDFEERTGSGLAENGFDVHQVNVGFRYSLF